MVKVEYMSCFSRIRSCARDILNINKHLVEDDEDSWELMERDHRLRSTFLYCDLAQIISHADDVQTKALFTDLGNRLMDSLEQLGHALEDRNISEVHTHHSDALLILQEILAELARPLQKKPNA